MRARRLLTPLLVSNAVCDLLLEQHLLELAPAILEYLARSARRFNRLSSSHISLGNLSQASQASGHQRDPLGRR